MSIRNAESIRKPLSLGCAHAVAQVAFAEDAALWGACHGKAITSPADAAVIDPEIAREAFLVDDMREYVRGAVEGFDALLLTCLDAGSADRVMGYLAELPAYITRVSDVEVLVVARDAAQVEDEVAGELPLAS